MSFDAIETSVQDAAPIELYDIETPTASYHLTSHDEDVIFGGLTYTSTVVARGPTDFVALGKPRELTISIIVTHPFVAQYMAAGGPPRSAVLTVATLHGTHTRRLWRGEVKHMELDGEVARFQVPNATDEQFAVKLPIISASRLCNHALYDRGCAIARSHLFSVTPTVLAISGTTISVSSMSGKPSGWATYGDVQRDADGERRAILDQTGDVLTLDKPFPTLNIGDALTVFAGCDHTIDTCLEKFGNVPNFGGHPELPSSNPTAPTGLGVISQA